MKYFLFTILISLFIGCESTPTQKPEKIFERLPAEDTAKDIFTIGDDQHVLAGENVTLKANILDDKKEFEDFSWHENGIELGNKKELNTDALSVGIHTITLKAIDKDGKTYTDTIIVTIKEPDASNTAPIANKNSFIVNEDTTYTTALQGSDIDGDKLTYLLVFPPHHGRLSGSFSNLHYTPDSNYFGEDSFEFKLFDGKIDSNIAKISITVNAINDAPTATSKNITVNEDEDVEVLFSGSDIEDSNVSFAVIDGPHHGSLSFGRYHPFPNYNGEDNITYTAYDSEGLHSNPATINISINPQDDAPTINTMAVINVNEGDPDHNNTITSTAESTSLAYTTSISLDAFHLDTNGSYSFHPYAESYKVLQEGQNQTIIIPIKVTDLNSGLYDEKNLTIMIRGKNNAPRAVNDAVTTIQGAITINILDNDEDIDNFSSVTVSNFSTPSHGTTSIGGGLKSIIYTPNANFSGTDSFTYDVHDGYAKSNEATVTVTIQRPFIMTVDINDSNNRNFKIPIETGRTGYDYNVDCDGDGAYEGTALQSAYTCAYPTTGEYNISITGIFPHLFFADSATTQMDRNKLLYIQQWGDIEWKDMNSTFKGCSQMAILANDSPNLRDVEDMSWMFASGSTSGGNPNPVNNDISDWNVSHVKKMNHMFYFAQDFNGSLQDWDVSSVVDMSLMFYKTSSFDNNISDWDVSQVVDMNHMFAHSRFNQDISDWNVSNVIDMHNMFNGNTFFDGNISNWDVSNVTMMQHMFAYTNFNQDISTWNISHVTNMNHMLYQASSFNQNLGDWNISNVTWMKNIFDNSNLSNINYTLTLEGWISSGVQNNVIFGAQGKKVTNPQARTDLETLYNWSITDMPYNRVPIFNPTTITLFEDNATVNVDFNVSDADNDPLSYSIESTPSSLDGFEIKSLNNFTFNPSHPSYQSLEEAEEKELSLDINVSDGTYQVTQTITIMITGVNDAPIAHYDYKETNEDTNVTFNLLSNDTDKDHSHVLTLIEVNATEGNFTFSANGNFTFTPVGYFDNLIENEEHNVSLTYHIKDEHNAISEANITIMVRGIDDFITINPIIMADSNLSDNDGIITGTITAYDPDGTITYHDSNTTNKFDIHNTTGAYTFTPDYDTYAYLLEGETTTINITIMIGTVEKTIPITIIGKNDAPRAIIGRDVIGTIHHFNASASFDPEGDTLSYAWKMDSISLSGNNIGFSRSNLSTGEHHIELTVTDTSGLSHTDTMTITVTPFTFHSVTTSAIESKWLEMVDLDKDGDLDILSAGNGGAQIAWYENRGNFTFTEHNMTTSTNSPESIKAADINDDGHLDILYTTYDSGASLILCLNDGNNNFNSCSTVTNSTDGLSFIEIVNLDTQEDSKPDIITASWENNKIEWLKGTGSGTFTGPHMIDSQNTEDMISIDTADFNKDGKVDIVAASNGSNRIDWHAYNTANNGNFESHWVADINDVFSVNVADINKDGYEDIIAVSKSDGKIYWYKSTASASPTFSTAFEVASLPNVYYASGVDMDNDGDIDILSASSESGGKIAWYENIGLESTFTEHIVANNVDDVVRVFPADIDNDGNMDIVAGDKAGNIIFYEKNTPDVIALLPKTGDTTDGGLGGDYNFARDNDKEIVTDSLTGIMWQDDSQVSSDAKMWLNVQGKCQQLNFGGYDDWRFPNRHELYYLAQKGDTILDTIFQNNGGAILFLTSKDYWTSSSNKVYVSFSKAYDKFAMSKNFTRCVREKPLTFDFIRDDNQNVVLDKRHQLMWEDGVNSDQKSSITNWDNAKSLCNALDYLGYSDWRLPNINELYSIFDDNGLHRAFQHKGSTSDKLVSSTTYKAVSTKAYGIDASNGLDEQLEKNYSQKFRCVRSIP